MPKAPTLGKTIPQFTEILWFMEISIHTPLILNYLQRASGQRQHHLIWLPDFSLVISFNCQSICLGHGRYNDFSTHTCSPNPINVGGASLYDVGFQATWVLEFYLIQQFCASVVYHEQYHFDKASLDQNSTESFGITWKQKENFPSLNHHAMLLFC